MYGYELIEKLTDEGMYAVELAGLSWPNSHTHTVKSLGDFLECLAGLGEKATGATVELVIPHAVYDDRTGDDATDLTNVEALRTNHDESELSRHSWAHSCCLAVVVYDGAGDGLGTEVSDSLADDIETLYEYGYLDDSDARNTVEQRLTEENWDNWIRHDLRLPQPATEALLQLTDEQARAVFFAALEEMSELDNWYPEFDGDSLRVDLERLAQLMTIRLETAGIKV
jgi:hypothetical protein